MIKHIVFWKLHENGTSAQRAESIESFRKKSEYLQTIIPEILEARIGANVVEGDVFHVCIDSVFADLDSLNRYIDHPEHLKVREFMNSISYDKTVFDYEY